MIANPADAGVFNLTKFEYRGEHLADVDNESIFGTAFIFLPPHINIKIAILKNQFLI